MAKYKEAIIYGIIILLGFIFLLSKITPKIVDIVKMELQLKTKYEEVEALKKEVMQMEEYERLKQTSITKTKRIYQPQEQTDTIENSFALMLDDIINITKYNNIKVFSIQYTYNPSDDEFVSKSQGQYDACRIDFELIADYQNFKNMLIELIKYPYFLKINKFKIIPYQKDKKILLIELEITLYVQKIGYTGGNGDVPGNPSDLNPPEANPSDANQPVQNEQPVNN